MSKTIVSRRVVSDGSTATLEVFLVTWLAASETHRAAALAALQGEPCAPATLGRTYDITQVARIAGVSRQTVHTSLRVGALRATPLYQGGRRRVREADLRLWLEGRAVG